MIRRVFCLLNGTPAVAFSYNDDDVPPPSAPPPPQGGTPMGGNVVPFRPRTRAVAVPVSDFGLRRAA